MCVCTTLRCSNIRSYGQNRLNEIHIVRVRVYFSSSICCHPVECFFLFFSREGCVRGKWHVLPIQYYAIYILFRWVCVDSWCHHGNSILFIFISSVLGRCGKSYLPSSWNRRPSSSVRLKYFDICPKSNNVHFMLECALSSSSPPSLSPTTPASLCRFLLLLFAIPIL